MSIEELTRVKTAFHDGLAGNVHLFTSPEALSGGSRVVAVFGVHGPYQK